MKYQQKQIILTCPMCDDGDVVSEIMNHKGYTFICAECGATPGYAKTREEALRLWNTRANNTGVIQEQDFNSYNSTVH